MTQPLLVIASHNEHKIREFAIGLTGVGLDIRSLSEFADVDEIVEDGQTFAANALIKARAAHNATGYPALGDDSGLEVDALGGLPGVHSHRFAGPQCDDALNNTLLLQKLEGFSREHRKARFRSILALVLGDGQEVLVEGSCEGEILMEPRGTGGFGYDPLFYIPELGATMAEISLEEKNLISHRGQAMAKLRQLLASGFTVDHMRFH